MGLSAYGSPEYVKKIYRLIDINPDGFRLICGIFISRVISHVQCIYFPFWLSAYAEKK